MHKILVVDDEKSILEMLKYCLEHEGYMVLTAETGEMAKNWVKEVKLDLAIVDLGLPDISGLQVCEFIKEDPKTRATPIIILTGNTSNDARIKGNSCANAELFLKADRDSRPAQGRGGDIGKIGEEETAAEEFLQGAAGLGDRSAEPRKEGGRGRQAGGLRP